MAPGTQQSAVVAPNRRRSAWVRVVIAWAWVCAGTASACGEQSIDVHSRVESATHTAATTKIDPTSPILAAGSPRSIVLVIADGTGVGAYSAGFYADGGRVESSPFRRFSHLGLVSTHPADIAQVTDSAASATALAAGVKTSNGRVGIDAHGQVVANHLEVAREHGWATGVVATSALTHATPASFVAHVFDREQTAAIAAQMAASAVDVVLGGGAADFAEHLPAMHARGIETATQLNALHAMAPGSSPVWGLFATGPMPHAPQRSPSTHDMATAALARLDDASSFFLVVEESQIDWAGHENDATWLAAEMRSFHRLVSGLVEYQRAHPTTLLLVTSDHETGSTAVFGHPPDEVAINFATTKHTGNFVPIWAVGPGSERFSGLLDNAEIGRRIRALVGSE